MAQLVRDSKVIPFPSFGQNLICTLFFYLFKVCQEAKISWLKHSLHSIMIYRATQLVDMIRKSYTKFYTELVSGDVPDPHFKVMKHLCNTENDIFVRGNLAILKMKWI
jgi:hypothetical protein